MTTSEAEDPQACLKMILESTIGNNYRNVALPTMCVAYCTREKPAEQRKNRGCEPLTCEVETVLRIVEDFVKTHPGELDRVVFYGKRSNLSIFAEVMERIVPVGRNGPSPDDVGTPENSRGHGSQRENRESHPEETQQENRGSETEKKCLDARGTECSRDIVKIKDTDEIKVDLDLGKLPEKEFDKDANASREIDTAVKVAPMGVCKDTYEHDVDGCDKKSELQWFCEPRRRRTATSSSEESTDDTITATSCKLGR